MPADNYQTYPVYHPDRDPIGYRDWLQKQKPMPFVDAAAIRSRQDWVRPPESSPPRATGWRRKNSPPLS